MAEVEKPCGFRAAKTRVRFLFSELRSDAGFPPPVGLSTNALVKVNIIDPSESKSLNSMKGRVLFTGCGARMISES